ncbi:MAG: iron transporter substrate-binding protein [Pseudonocardiales bacterium]|nr:iron transporter substrate-binding protein [Pseudonocardiales bacterium]
MTRSRRGGLLVPLLTLIVALSGCSSSNAPVHTAVHPSGPSDTSAEVPAVDEKKIVPLPTVPTPVLPVTVTDDDGHRVTVTDASRIIPLTGSIAEVVFSLGLGANVVGRDIATTFSAASALPVVTHAHDVSAESVLSLRPTVVIADVDTGPPEAISQLRSAGVAIVILAVATTVASVEPRIHAVATALGVPTAGDQLAQRTSQEISAATAARPVGTKKLTVAFLYLRGTAGVYLIGGKDSGADSLIEAAGGVDAGTKLGLDSFSPITSEALIAARPDVLLLMTDGLASVGGVSGLAKIPGIAQTPAGRSKQVIAIEDGVLLNFGPRTAQVITVLAGELSGMK